MYHRMCTSYEPHRPHGEINLLRATTPMKKFIICQDVRSSNKEVTPVTEPAVFKPHH